MSTRTLKFEPAEMDRIGEVCKSLGTTPAELIHLATMDRVAEYEGLTEAMRRRWPETVGYAR